MDSQTIIDFLVERDEFVDNESALKLKSILKLDDKIQIEKELKVFFKSFFPDFDSNLFFKTFFSKKSDDLGRVSILKSFEKEPCKRSVDDFVRYFNIRFKAIERMLRERTELTGLTSINRISGKKDRDTVSVIGMILNISETKNGHFILELEDLSGVTKVLVNKDNEELIPIVKDLVLDEVIGLVGTSGGDLLFAKKILHPDIPLSKELKKSPFDHYAVFLGDFHVGSKEFLDNEFKKFLLWLNGKMGTPAQREIAKKVKYLILTGDIVEGVGIYPGQQNDLLVDNMKGQYELLAEYLKKIPSNIKIIISPGNHDTGRLAEPQLPIEKDYASSLWDLPNVIMVSNPAYVSLDVSDIFSGLDVLIYHGGSLIYYSDVVPRIRAAGGQKAVDEIMKFLLKRRHLAPSHGSTLYVPDVYEDALVIDPVPDIFVTGHIHRVVSTTYRNVSCLNTSCWTAITEDQEKRGLAPQPARAILMSLKTRDVKIMNFNTQKDVTSVAELKRLKQ